MNKINIKEFEELTQPEQNKVLAERYNNIIDKFEKIDKLEQKIDQVFNKIKPLVDKIPTELIKEKASTILSKFRKN